MPRFKKIDIEAIEKFANEQREQRENAERIQRERAGLLERIASAVERIVERLERDWPHEPPFNPYAGMELEEDKEEDPDITIKLSTLERWHDSIIWGTNVVDPVKFPEESEQYLQTLDEILELREKYNVV